MLPKRAVFVNSRRNGDVSQGRAVEFTGRLRVRARGRSMLRLHLPGFATVRKLLQIGRA